jgi:hypothetical protein
MTWHAVVQQCGWMQCFEHELAAAPLPPGVDVALA